jgi:hypothetical protein
MKSDKKKIKSKEMFDSLVRNAIDFLEHSAFELEEKPKYSVINFCTAVELFLKARLMLEHWNLIYEDPKIANFTQFLQGNFKSVGMIDAIGRLKKVVDLEITEDEEKCFDKIREHRNQLIHFFNKAYINKPDAKIVESVVAEECKGWFYLYQLLTKKWKNEFLDHISEIERLNKLMLGRRKYLQAKFSALSSDIKKYKKKGIKFSICQACGYEPGKQSVIAEPLISTDCLVCETQLRQIIISCPNCKNSIDIDDLGEGYCENCEASIDMEYLLEKYAKFVHLGKGEFKENRAYCSDCEYCEQQQQSVVLLENIWVCLSCLEIHQEIGHCGYCNNFIAGDLEDSFLSGCFMCDGQMGHYLNSSAYDDD